MDRCPWASEPPELQYHDEEWGVPVRDDRALFEHLALEAAQCGLSWRLVLKRRQAYREAFHGFDIERVAAMGDDEVAHAVETSGIVKNRPKALSVVNNARQVVELRARHGSLSSWMWAFVGDEPRVNAWGSLSEVPSQSDESVSMSKAMKKLGFTFVGPTTLYAHMQACGMVDDHLVGCFRKAELRGMSR
jgi:DNA-3-methyladenine glycosylase I